MLFKKNTSIYMILKQTYIVYTINNVVFQTNNNLNNSDALRSYIIAKYIT